MRRLRLSGSFGSTHIHSLQHHHCPACTALQHHYPAGKVHSHPVTQPLLPCMHSRPATPPLPCMHCPATPGLPCMNYLALPCLARAQKFQALPLNTSTNPAKSSKALNAPVLPCSCRTLPWALHELTLVEIPKKSTVLYSLRSGDPPAPHSGFTFTGGRSVKALPVSIKQ